MIEKLSEWIWNLHGMNCRQAIRLASRSMDEKLRFRERFQLRCHFLLCSYCHHYSKHLQAIRMWLRKEDVSPSVRNHPHLPEDARKRILQALKEGKD